MTTKVQFNIQLPPSLAAKVRADARRSNRSLDDVARTIFADFFNGWTLADRQKFYQHAGMKRTGRPLRTSKIRRNHR